eukprot:381698_1
MSFPWSWFHIRKKRLISGCTGIPTIYKFLGVLAICVVIYIITPDTLPPESTPTTRSENSEDETLTFDSDDAAVTTSSNSSPDSMTLVPDKQRGKDVQAFRKVNNRFMTDSTSNPPPYEIAVSGQSYKNVQVQAPIKRVKDRLNVITKPGQSSGPVST